MLYVMFLVLPLLDFCCLKSTGRPVFDISSQAESALAEKAFVAMILGCAKGSQKYSD